MGHTLAKVRVSSPVSGECFDYELLVDTGSTYTWIWRRRLEGIGLKPFARWKFRTIDGGIIIREIGEAVLECLGERATRIIVFAEEGEAEVLGVDALEGLRLEVDPVTRQLRKVPGGILPVS